MAEYWDLYDADRKMLGRTIKRGAAFAEGEYYVCCEVWMQNSEGKLLMTQRHPDKKSGGPWGVTRGGGLSGGTPKAGGLRGTGGGTGHYTLFRGNGVVVKLGSGINYYFTENCLEYVFVVVSDIDETVKPCVPVCHYRPESYCHKT